MAVFLPGGESKELYIAAKFIISSVSRIEKMPNCLKAASQIAAFPGRAATWLGIAWREETFRPAFKTPTRTLRLLASRANLKKAIPSCSPSRQKRRSLMFGSLNIHSPISTTLTSEVPPVVTTYLKPVPA